MRVERLTVIGWACYALAVVLPIAVLVVGLEAQGARRWLDFGSFTVQPSELAKLGLLLVLADVLGSDRPPSRRFGLSVVLALVPNLLAQYLRGRQTDLAFASLVEQFGLVAGAVAILATLVLVWRVALASRAPRTRRGSLIGAGLAALLGVQVVICLGGNLGV